MASSASGSEYLRAPIWTLSGSVDPGGGRLQARRGGFCLVLTDDGRRRLEAVHWRAPAAIGGVRTAACCHRCGWRACRGCPMFRRRRVPSAPQPGSRGQSSGWPDRSIPVQYTCMLRARAVAARFDGNSHQQISGFAQLVEVFGEEPIIAVRIPHSWLRSGRESRRSRGSLLAPMWVCVHRTQSRRPQRPGRYAKSGTEPQMPSSAARRTSSTLEATPNLA